MSADVAAAVDDERGGIWSEIAGSHDDPLLVLVHGSMDRSAGLLKLSRRLDDRFSVLRYDRRGYGRSLGAGPPYSVARHVADLAAVVDAALADRDDRADRRRPIVFGHSFGGNVALGLAAARPELFAGVIVYETPLSWFDWWPGTTAGAAAMVHEDPAEAAEAFMRRLVGDAKWERLPAGTREARRAEGPAMVGELADLRRRAPWEAEAITVPVLAVAGERARPHHREAMVTLAAMLPDCRSVVVDGAGHVGPNTHPDAVAEVVADFADAVG